MTVFKELSKPGRPAALPPGRSTEIRSVDGTRLHVEVFGRQDGRPVVLAHGITCALGVWGNQIADLAADHRVIAYDHRGHGRSQAPRRRGQYSLDFLAADLDAVLAATLNPGDRAVIAGHSMGGIAIMSWAQRYPQRVSACADAVALVNTTSGDLLRQLKFLSVPDLLALPRERVAGQLIKRLGAAPLVPGARTPVRKVVGRLAVGSDADPVVADYVFELFRSTSPAGRHHWAEVLVEGVGARHLGLANLSVPALVIGSSRDRLLPMVASRRIAADAPNLWSLVELSGGHCAILERPDEVNRQLRALLAATGG